MRARGMGAAAMLVLAAAASLSGAQAPPVPPTVPAGAVIRVTLAERRPRVGQFVAATATEVEYRVFADTRLTARRTDILRLEVRTGVDRLRGMGRGVARGGAVFGVLGALIGWGMSIPGDTPMGIVRGALGFGAFGIGIGGWSVRRSGLRSGGRCRIPRRRRCPSFRA